MDSLYENRIMQMETGICMLGKWIDSKNQGHDPEAWLWHRVTKIGEEFGETIEALSGALDCASRKDTSGINFDHVRYELLDVAVAALAAYDHLDTNQGTSIKALGDHIRFLLNRAKLVPKSEDAPEVDIFETVQREFMNQTLRNLDQYQNATGQRGRVEFDIEERGERYILISKIVPVKSHFEGEER